MRGVYGKARLHYVETQVGVAAPGAPPPFVESSVSRGIISDAEGKRLYDEQYPAAATRATVWEVAKVGAVLTLSVLAVVTAGKVLSPGWAKR